MPAKHVPEELCSGILRPQGHAVCVIVSHQACALHYGVVLHLVAEGYGFEFLLQDFCNLGVLHILLICERRAKLDALHGGKVSEAVFCIVYGFLCLGSGGDVRGFVSGRFYVFLSARQNKGETGKGQGY